MRGSEWWPAALLCRLDYLVSRHRSSLRQAEAKKTKWRRLIRGWRFTWPRALTASLLERTGVDWMETKDELAGGHLIGE
jgi:hypothetical protein